MSYVVHGPIDHYICFFQVSFSDHNLSVVPHHRSWWGCHKLFTFSSSSLQPQGLFQPSLAQSILGLRGSNLVQMKPLPTFPMGDDYEIPGKH